MSTNQVQTKPIAPTAPAQHALVKRSRSSAKPQVDVSRRSDYWSGRWSDHRAWLISCIFHTTLFLILALIARPLIRGTSGTNERPIAIDVLQSGGTGDQFFTEGGSSPAGANAANVSGGASSASSSTAADAAGPPVSVNELMSELIGDGDASAMIGAQGGSGNGGDGSGLGGRGQNGNGTGRGPVGITTTSFMGVPGTGSSFVYVLDRSESMNEFGGAPLRFAKSELINSISSLQENHQFQIVFYNEAPAALTSTSPSGRMNHGTDISKERTANFVRSIRAIGGTEHVPALKLGLSFGPNVLFFLTDAAEPSLSEAQLVEIQQRAERSLTTIHAIQFNSGPATNDGGWLRRLAEMNRGKYRYVDISSLD